LGAKGEVGTPLQEFLECAGVSNFDVTVDFRRNTTNLKLGVFLAMNARNFDF
jgi:hypothetical protein